MKYVVIVPDGAADYPVAEIGGKTPLQAAALPNIDRLAAEGAGGLVKVIPDARHAGSDIGNLELFGYDTLANYSGRAPLEARSMGIELAKDGVAFRCNLINRRGDILHDYSAGHISTPEADELIALLNQELGSPQVRFYTGVGYRHLMIYGGGPEHIETHAPHDIMGREMSAHLPVGAGQELVRDLMEKGAHLLSAAAINLKRDAAGELAANGIWLWGSGRALQLEKIPNKLGISGAVISAVDLVRGIGLTAGLEIVDVPGITGYTDTNYKGKGQYALEALRRLDLVYVHIEAPDEAGHNGDLEAKIGALEDIDRHVVGPLAEGVSVFGDCRILLSPDHRTPLELRTHSREPVPFLLWGTGVESDALRRYDEHEAERGSLQVGAGHQLMELLVRGGKDG
jgi:2,3-bisphosphoglycerate-independent phosphoglycerate mutase